MSEPAWMRQRGLACEFCGAPGHFVPISPPVTVVYSDAEPTSCDLETAISCPEHRFLVVNRRERLRDESRFAEYEHGRPKLGDEPYPEQIRRSVGTILRRLRGWDGPEDGR